jgi:hypothetical protein
MGCKKGECLMKKLTVNVLVLILVFSLLVIAGCGNGEEDPVALLRKHAGVYISESNSEHYIEIRGNGTFEMEIERGYTMGSCMIEKGELLLSAGSFADSMAISDGVITDSEGTRFVKQ